MMSSTLFTSQKKSNFTQTKIIFASALLLLTLTLALLLPSHSFAESGKAAPDISRFNAHHYGVSLAQKVFVLSRLKEITSVGLH
jgi:hypothetical protein